MTGRDGERVEADPVQALMAAEQDGLLEYRGWSEGDRYEVVFAGETRMLPSGEVRATVQRLRAVGGVGGQVVEVAGDGTHVVDVGGRRWRVPVDQVVDWGAGFAAAVEGEGRQHAGADQLGEIRELLARPSLADQCRMVLLGLMESRVPKMTRQELADRVVPVRTKKTVVDALMFGEGLSMDLAESLIAVFGMRWVVGAAVVTAAEGRPVGQLPQAPGMARLSRIVDADARGWLRYVGEPAPNKARRLRRFMVTVGPREFTVEAERLPAWLDGVAAFHEGGSAQVG